MEDEVTDKTGSAEGKRAFLNCRYYTLMKIKKKQNRELRQHQVLQTKSERKKERKKLRREK